MEQSTMQIEMRDGVPQVPQHWELQKSEKLVQLRDNEGKLYTMAMSAGDVLSPTDVHIDAALSNYAAGYKQFGLVADEVCPVVPVDKASNYYYTWDKENAFNLGEPLANGGAERVPEISPSLSSTTYATVGYAIASPVSTELQANADSPLRPQIAAMRRCLNALLNAREGRVSTLLTTSGNWSSSSFYAAATAKWNGGSGADPVADIQARIAASLTPINCMVMAEHVYFAFITNSAVQKYIALKTNVKPSVGSVSASEMSAILELPRIIVARAKKLSSAGAPSYIWGNNVPLLYVEPGVPSDGESISTAKTFRWLGGQTTPDGRIEGTFLIRTYFDPRRGARGTQVTVVAHNDAEKMTAGNAGGLITGAYA